MVGRQRKTLADAGTERSIKINEENKGEGK